MKIRTDFVTNSSSSSFIAFSIKSKKMIESLKEIGYQFELASADTITESDTIITPDGDEIIPQQAVNEEELTIYEFDSDKTVFEWFLDMFDGYDAFFESCEDDEDEAQKIKAIEKSIQECEIVGGEAITDDESSYCMHVTIKNGKRTVALLTDEMWDNRDDTCLGIALFEENDFEEFADKYGEITEINI